MDLVSIIIPMFNAETTIGRCLDSCMHQSYSQIQIVVINDGSSDHSLEIAEHYASVDKRIIVVSQANSGASAARNHGLKIAEGRYIQFLDSDDWLELNAVETAVAAIYNNGADFVIYGFKIFQNDTLLRTPNPGVNCFYAGDPYEKFKPFEWLMSSSCNKLYKSTYIRSPFRENLVYAEDSVFNYENFNTDTSVVTIPDCLYNVQLSTTNSINKRYINNKLSDCIYNRALIQERMDFVFDKQHDAEKLSVTSLGSIISIILIIADNIGRQQFMREIENAYKSAFFTKTIYETKPQKIYLIITQYFLKTKQLFLLWYCCRFLSFFKKRCHAKKRR